MKIKLNKIDLQYLNDIIAIKNNNIDINDIFLFLFNAREEIHAHFQNQKVDKDTYIKYLLEMLDASNDEYEYLYNLFNFSLQKIETKTYLSNPYFQTVKVKETKYKNYSIEYDKYLSYECFPFDEISIDSKTYQEKINAAYFDTSFPFLSLKENGVTWMSITPSEINTMQKDIDKMFGDIAVFGLGLGYFVFMCALKKDVKSITIIEKDETIIELYQKFLFPFYPNKEKIHIVNEDAVFYLKHYTKKFDQSYFDIYHNPQDALPLYLQLIKLEKNPSYYWLENSIIAYMRRLLLLLFEESLDTNHSYRYDYAENIEDQIINQLYFILKDKNIFQKEDIDSLLTNSSIKSLMKKIILK